MSQRKTFTVIVTDRRIYRVSVDAEHHMAASDPEHAAIDLVDGPDPGVGTVELIAIESTAETVADDDAEAHPPSAG